VAGSELRIKIQDSEYVFIPEYGLVSAEGSDYILLNQIQSLSPWFFKVLHNEIPVILEGFDPDSREFVLRVNGNRVSAKVQDSLDEIGKISGLTRGLTRKAQTLRSPMPGLVIQVNVESGAHVKKGDTLLILEAMKMENTIKASADAYVEEVICAPGQSVEKGSVLIRFRD